jgi:hypothetical protein
MCFDDQRADSAGKGLAYANCTRRDSRRGARKLQCGRAARKLQCGRGARRWQCGGGPALARPVVFVRTAPGVGIGRRPGGQGACGLNSCPCHVGFYERRGAAFAHLRPAHFVGERDTPSSGTSKIEVVGEPVELMKPSARSRRGCLG